MGKFKEKHGHSRLKEVLNDLGDVGKPILSLLGETIPNAGILTKVASKITTSKELEQQKKDELLNLVSIIADDLDSAREHNTDIQISQFSSWMAKNVPYMLDLFISIIWGFVTVFIVAQTFKLIHTDVDLVPVLGIYSGITGVFVQIINFHRGSSQDSRMKDLTKMTK